MNIELKTRKSTRSVFNRVGLATLVMGLVVNIVQMILIISFKIYNPSFVDSHWFNYFLVAVSFYLIGFPVCCLIVRGLPNGEKREEKKLTAGEFFKFFCISYFFVIVLNTLTIILGELLIKIKGEAVINPLDTVLSNSSIWATLIFAGILSPIIEEVLFRGVLLNKLKIYGDKIAIVTTAILFGLFHENFSQFFYAVGLGIIFAYVTLKTGTIKYSILLHIIINIMGGVINTLILKNPITTIIYGAIIWGIVIAGLVFFIKNYKKRVLLPGEVTIEKGKVFSTTCINLGMILNLIFSIACMVYLIVV